MKLRTMITGALLAMSLGFGWVAPVSAKSIKVVAAENFYGDIAQQIGADQVEVVSVLSNPDQDPHLFEASPSLARQLQQADLIITNGAGYDGWMERLAQTAKQAARLDVGALARVKDGANPHLWYQVSTTQAAARAIAAQFAQRDPAHAPQYQAGLARFESDMVPLHQQIERLKARVQGQAVTASEPVFGYMAQALGLEMRNEAFQLAVMNNTEPSVSQVQAFEADLTGHKVRVMIYNAQASSPAVERLKALAEAQHVPVVGITETMPAGQHYQSWMQGQLEALGKVLAP